MGISDELRENRIGDQMLYFAFRVPKKNHDAMVLAVPRSLFQLNNKRTYKDVGLSI
jgi:hypothetical protein